MCRVFVVNVQTLFGSLVPFLCKFGWFKMYRYPFTFSHILSTLFAFDSLFVIFSLFVVDSLN